MVIKTTGLTKKYGDFTALEEVSMHVEKGAVYGFVGKNGAGKTTFFKCLMGLTEKSAGNIEISGNQNLNAARSKIGFMIGPAFFSYMTARANIEYYRRLKGITDKSETDRVLKLVGLYGVKKPFKAFSMGMKQRLGIANALLGHPEIVILDEPLNGLDPQGILDIRNIIKEINATYGTTFIISSHILSELDLVATQFGFIDQGRLLKEVSHEELHRLTSKSLIVETDDMALAQQVLATELGIEKLEASAGEIILEAYLSEPDKVSAAIVGAGLKLYSIRKREMTLEEYFLNLIGGVHHD